MAVVSTIANESHSDFHEKLELSLGYAGRMIEEDERWLAQNSDANSKLMKLFSKCKCYLEDTRPPILYSTLNPNSAPFVSKSQASRLNLTSPPFVATAAPAVVPPVPLVVSTEVSSMALPNVVQPRPPMVPPTLIPAAAAPIAPTWVPPPMVPSEPMGFPQGPPMVPYPAVYQMPYHQPLVSPPLCNLNPCPFLPTYQQPGLSFAYPGQLLAPSPPLVMSPAMTLLSRQCSPESSVSLPATPVASPDPLPGFSTLVPRYPAPVYNTTLPYYPPNVSYSHKPNSHSGAPISYLYYGPTAY